MSAARLLSAELRRVPVPDGGKSRRPTLAPDLLIEWATYERANRRARLEHARHLRELEQKEQWFFHRGR